MNRNRAYSREEGKFHGGNAYRKSYVGSADVVPLFGGCEKPRAEQHVICGWLLYLHWREKMDIRRQQNRIEEPNRRSSKTTVIARRLCTLECRVEFPLLSIYTYGNSHSANNHPCTIRDSIRVRHRQISLMILVYLLTPLRPSRV